MAGGDVARRVRFPPCRVKVSRTQLQRHDPGGLPGRDGSSRTSGWTAGPRCASSTRPRGRKGRRSRSPAWRGTRGTRGRTEETSELEGTRDAARKIAKKLAVQLKTEASRKPGCAGRRAASRPADGPDTDESCLWFSRLRGYPSLVRLPDTWRARWETSSESEALSGTPPVLVLLLVSRIAFSLESSTLPTGTGGRRVAVSADGTAWFSAQFSGAVEHVGPCGHVETLRVPFERPAAVRLALQTRWHRRAADLAGERLGRVGPRREVHGSLRSRGRAGSRRESRWP